MRRSSDQVFCKAQAFDEMKSSPSSHLAKSESSKIMLPSKHPPSILPHHSIFLQHLSAHSSEDQEKLKDGASDKQNLTEDTEQKPARCRSTKKKPLVDFAAVMLLSSEEASASNRNKSNAANTSFDCEHELQKEQEHQLLGCDKLSIQGGERSQMITGKHLNDSQKYVLHQRLCSFEQTGKRPDHAAYTTIAREINELNGGRSVDTKCVQHWFWRPTLPSPTYTPNAGSKYTSDALISEAEYQRNPGASQTLPRQHQVNPHEVFEEGGGCSETGAKSERDEKEGVVRYSGRHGDREVRYCRKKNTPSPNMRGSSASCSSLSAPSSYASPLQFYWDKELSIPISEAFNTDERGHCTFSQPPSELKRCRGKAPVKHHAHHSTFLNARKRECSIPDRYAGSVVLKIEARRNEFGPVAVLKMKNDLLGFANQASLCASIGSGR